MYFDIVLHNILLAVLEKHLDEGLQDGLIIHSHMLREGAPKVACCLLQIIVRNASK